MLEKKLSILLFISFFSLNFCIGKMLALERKPNSDANLQSGIIDASNGDGTSAMETFASAFTKEVFSSKVLSDLFNLNETTPSALAKFLYDDAMAIMSQQNIPDAAIIADSLTRPITESVKFFTLQLVVKPYANAMAKFLFNEGVLHMSNAMDLASGYAKEMQHNAFLSVVPGDSVSKFKAISDGYKNYLKNFGLFVPEKFADISSGFGNEMKLVGKQFSK